MDRERLADVERRLYALDGELSPVPPKPTLDRCQCYSSMHDACFYELFGATRHAPAPAAPESESECRLCEPGVGHNAASRRPASSKGEKPMSEEEIGNHLIERMSGLNVAWAHDYQARDVGHFARELLSRDLDVELIVERNQLAQENAKLRKERDAQKLDFERGCPGPDRIMHVAVTDALGLDPVNGSLELVEALKRFREERIQTVRVKSREMADEARIAGLSQAVDRLENERDALKWRLHEAETLLPAQPERTP